MHVLRSGFLVANRGLPQIAQLMGVDFFHLFLPEPGLGDSLLLLLILFLVHLDLGVLVLAIFNLGLLVLAAFDLGVLIFGILLDLEVVAFVVVVVIAVNGVVVNDEIP
jgi:hypothetical protein